MDRIKWCNLFYVILWLIVPLIYIPIIDVFQGTDSFNLGIYLMSITLINLFCILIPGYAIVMCFILLWDFIVKPKNEEL